jgi:hypothetical protein
VLLDFCPIGVPQHILIHLCEKGVIEPDFADTSGRGKRREFSRRNLFEFALALALRRFELPVATTALIVRVLRSFARAVAKDVPGFVLPDALAGAKLDFALHLYDGEQLVLSVVGSSLRKPLLLSTRIGNGGRSSETTPRVARLDEPPEKYEACLEIDLSEIARNVLTI